MIINYVMIINNVNSRYKLLAFLWLYRLLYRLLQQLLQLMFDSQLTRQLSQDYWSLDADTIRPIPIVLIVISSSVSYVSLREDIGIDRNSIGYYKENYARVTARDSNSLARSIFPRPHDVITKLLRDAFTMVLL